MDCLNRSQISALSIIADPDKLPGVENALRVFTVPELLKTAEQHNISAIVFHKLLKMKTQLSEPLRNIVDTAQEELRLSASVMMDLDFHGQTLSDKLTQNGIQHRLVKGHVFAQDLYADLNQRPYTDVDIVVAQDQFHQAINVAKECGLNHFTKDILDHTERDQEAKLTKPDSPHLLIELHANLTHMRALRRHKTIGLPQIEHIYDWQTPFVGHFIIAVAHASLGHKFHNLKLIVDCLQAMRKLQKSDLPHLEAVVTALNLETEVATCIHLCAALFTDETTQAQALMISQNLSLPSGRGLVRPVDVMQAPFKKSLQSRWRRRLFRLYQLS